jgi:drug/metabolite transporter (DMT)-like permease
MSDNLRGAAWILASCVAATCMMLGVRGASGTLHPLQIVFGRFVVGFILVLPFLLSRGSEVMATRRLPLLVLRGFLGFVAVSLGFYCVSVLPLVTATVLFYTAPLFVTLLAIPLLGERPGWRRISATFGGFLGTAVVLGFDPGGFHPAMLVAVGSAVIFAFSLIIGKMLATTERPMTIMLYFSVVTVVASAAPAALVWQTPTIVESALLAVVGVFAAARVYFDIRGYAAGEASFVAPFGYFRIILVGAAGFLVFAEIPTSNALVGAAMIIVSTLYIAEREARWGRARSQL